jgi:hypothetical protein
MSPEDFAKVVELVKHRPIQFCIFLKALLGEKAMVHMMVQAINTAKQVP